MKVLIYTNDSEHQKKNAMAMRAGLARHGIAAEFVWRKTAAPCDMAVVWGWRPPEFMKQLTSLGARILVQERAYLPDRFEWTSLGWDGLNNRATFPACADGGERFRKYWPDLLKPWKIQDGHALLCGQVPGDAAVYGVNLDVWAQQACDELRRAGHRVIFRPHPRTKPLGPHPPVRPPGGAALSTAALMGEDLIGARLCVTYNSNSGVESACAGIPTVTLDEGAMAWPVAGHSISAGKFMPDRTAWAHRLSYAQWMLGEIASGEAWECLKQAM